MWSKDRHAAAGKAAETRAEQFLQGLGLITRERNFRCKAGEIDLIMQAGDLLVFVEVRLRNNPFFSSASESVTWRKQQKIIRAARFYLLQHRLLDKMGCRFDVVAFNRPTGDPEWITNAFSEV